MLGFAICTVVIGCLLYFIFPIAFLNEDLDLQGIILLWLLAGIIGGLSLFLNNFQTLCEVILQKVLLFWEKVHIKRLLLKNTLIHSSKNRQTALIYSISLAILNFVYISYYLELSSLSMRSYFEKGGELVLENSSVFTFQKYVKESEMADRLEYSWLMNPIRGADRVDYSERMPGIPEFVAPVYSIQHIEFALTDLSKQYEQEISVSMASPNYISNMSDTSSYKPFKSFGDPLNEVTKGLFKKHNFRSIIIPRSIYINFYGEQWDPKKPTYLYLQMQDPQKRKYFYKVRIAAVVDYLPGVEFSVMPYSNKSGVLVSPDIFFEINEITHKRIEDMTISKVILNPSKEKVDTSGEYLVNYTGVNFDRRLEAEGEGAGTQSQTQQEANQGSADQSSRLNKEKAPTETKPDTKPKPEKLPEKTHEDILNDLNKFGEFSEDQIFRLSSEVKEFENTEKILNMIFNGTTFLILCICFFNLTAAMSSKITASRTQLGIMRCLGLSKFRTALLFLYDSFLVVFSASIIGLVAGGALAWLLILQRTLFLDIPMQFHFNFGNLAVIVVAAFLSSFFSAFIPMMVFLKRPLSQISK